MAAGIIFYRFHPSRGLEFLLQKRTYKKKTYLEDFGGKREPSDKTFYDVAAREAAEESNGAFLSMPHVNYKQLIQLCTIYILRLMIEESYLYTHSKSSYHTFIVRISYDDSKNLNFGNVEIHPQFHIKRSVSWYTCGELIDIDYTLIHPRIRHVYKKLIYLHDL